MKISVNLLILFGAVALFSPISGELTISELQKPLNNVIKSYEKLISEVKTYKDFRGKNGAKLAKNIADIYTQLEKDLDVFVTRNQETGDARGPLDDVIYEAEEKAAETKKDALALTTKKRENFVSALDVSFVLKYAVRGAEYIVNKSQMTLRKFKLSKAEEKQINVFKDKYGVIAEKAKKLRSIVEPFIRDEDYLGEN